MNNIKNKDILLIFAAIFWVVIMLMQGALRSPFLLSFGLVYVLVYFMSRADSPKNVNSITKWLSYLSILGTLFWVVGSNGVVSEAPLTAVYFYALPIIAFLAGIFISKVLDS